MTFLKNISNTPLSDNELITAYKKSKDPQLVSLLYQRYMDLVFGVCLKYLKDAEKSKDAVMDIYAEICNKLMLHEVDYFKAWLQVLARNFCLMQLRSPRNLKTSEFEPGLMQSSQNTHLENEAFEKEENLLQLERCIEKLPADQKQSIELFFLQKKCYNEISIITGFEWSKVRSFIQNGKRNLKLCMDSIKENL